MSYTSYITITYANKNAFMQSVTESYTSIEI